MSESAWLPLLNRHTNARLLILHADDVGMCQSSVSAFQELVEAGTLTSASAMVPCPWFPDVARYCASRPEIDMGVHLTLTSEWHGYRWGPVSDSAGLTDAAGYFHRDREGLNRSASPASVEREMRAQIEKFIAAGITPTHIDAHMFSCLSPRFIRSYACLAQEFRIPALLWPAAWEDVLFPASDIAGGPPALQHLLARGFVPIDRVTMLDSTQPDRRGAQLRAAIAGLLPGVTHLLVHPSKDTPELRAITPNGWRNRLADYEALLDTTLLDFVHSECVELIGYRELRKALYGD